MRRIGSTRRVASSSRPLPSAACAVEEELAEQLTLFHERARALVELSMVRLASENAEREIERFARALEQDLILPEDF